VKEAKPNLVFDLDGTLIDSCPGISASLAAAFAAAGRVMPKVDLRAIIGPPIRIIAARMDSTLTEGELAQIELAFRAAYDNDGWREAILYDSVADTLNAFYLRGCRMFIVTNKPRIPTEKVLAHLGLDHLFQKIVTRDSRTPGYGSKAEMLSELLQEQALELHSTIMTGDTREDEEAASASGLPFVYATYGYGALHAPQRPIAVFSDLARVLAEHESSPKDTLKSA
jgi:phosphoglycolate phosphatase